MPFAPLWSSAFNTPGGQLSNATVENRFRQAKSHLMPGERLPYGTFFSKNLAALNSIVPRLVSS